MTGGTPPRDLRPAILAAARDARPPGYPDPEALPPQAAPYGLEVRKLDTLLHEVTRWDLPVVDGMTAQQLVNHLTEHDAWLATSLRLTPSKPQEKAHRAWRDQAFALLRHAVFTPLTGRVDLAGLSMRIGNAYLNRAFETWIHADDLRLAMGLPVEPPPPAHLRDLADLQIRSLPTALRLSGRDHPGHGVRVTLTGAVTEEWFISLSRDEPADAAQPSVTITADALEFCYLAANRRTPAEIPLATTGNQEIATDLLAAMTFFSQE